MPNKSSTDGPIHTGTHFHWEVLLSLLIDLNHSSFHWFGPGQIGLIDLTLEHRTTALTVKNQWLCSIPMLLRLIDELIGFNWSIDWLLIVFMIFYLFTIYFFNLSELNFWRVYCKRIDFGCVVYGCYHHFQSSYTSLIIHKIIYLYEYIAYSYLYQYELSQWSMTSRIIWTTCTSLSIACPDKHVKTG